MAEEPIQQQAVQPEAATPAAAPSDAEQLHSFLRDNGRTLIIGIGVAVALALGVGAYRNYKQSVVLRASQLLMSAQSIEQIQQVANQYASTPSGPVAQLVLAAQYYDAGQYDLAQFAYAQFEQKYPKHAMAQAAKLGKAQCMEASGQLDMAVGAYEAFLAAEPGSYMAPLATLGLARTLTQQGKYAEAKAKYEDFIAANPESSWTPNAETALMFVEKEMRASEKGITEPVPAPAAAEAVSPVLLNPPSDPAASAP